MAEDDNTMAKLALGGTALLGVIALGVVLTRDSTPKVPEVTTAEVVAPDKVVKPEPKSAAQTSSQPALTDEQFTVTESGLGMHTVTEGSGDAPVEGSIVSVHYTGWVDGGVQFFSTRERKEATRWPLGEGPMKGLDEGVAGLKKGGKAVFRIPPELAFGQRRRGRIPPSSTLVIEAELVDISPPRTPPEAPPKVAESDWTTTEAGLKYYDLATGTGVKPTKGQRVVVEYTGWLVEGKRIDSSYSNIGPVRFDIGVGKVMKGWDLGVIDMPVGTKRVFYIPWSLAYGESGRKPLIPPKSDLIFEVELLGVE